MRRLERQRSGVPISSVSAQRGVTSDRQRRSCLRDILRPERRLRPRRRHPGADPAAVRAPPGGDAGGAGGLRAPDPGRAVGAAGHGHGGRRGGGDGPGPPGVDPADPGARRHGRGAGRPAAGHVPRFPPVGGRRGRHRRRGGPVGRRPAGPEVADGAPGRHAGRPGGGVAAAGGGVRLGPAGVPAGQRGGGTGRRTDHGLGADRRPGGRGGGRQGGLAAAPADAGDADLARRRGHGRSPMAPRRPPRRSPRSSRPGRSRIPGGQIPPPGDVAGPTVARRRAARFGGRPAGCGCVSCCGRRPADSPQDLRRPGRNLGRSWGVLGGRWLVASRPIDRGRDPPGTPARHRCGHDGRGRHPDRPGARPRAHRSGTDAARPGGDAVAGRWRRGGAGRRPGPRLGGPVRAADPAGHAARRDRPPHVRRRRGRGGGGAPVPLAGGGGPGPGHAAGRCPRPRRGDPTRRDGPRCRRPPPHGPVGHGRPPRPHGRPRSSGDGRRPDQPNIPRR
jgi:hypothetical protein